MPRRSVENAIKYADYAVGQYFELARQSLYYANTVCVLVADHNVRVGGDDSVPVPGFHIPGLIHLQRVPARRYRGGPAPRQARQHLARRGRSPVTGAG